jgi:hypothetical protein
MEDSAILEKIHAVDNSLVSLGATCTARMDGLERELARLSEALIDLEKVQRGLIAKVSTAAGIVSILTALFMHFVNKG